MAILYMIGLGLSDERDVTVKGLEIIQKSEKIFLESYTSLLNIDVKKLEEYYKKEIVVAYRETCEIEINEILDEIALPKNKEKIFSFLVVGDPFCATTHSDLQLRAIQRGIKVKAIHNASIMNAIGVCGLQLYSYGQTVSVPFFTEKWRPYSFLEKVAFNFKNKFHTLVLLDIRVREISDENLLKDKKIYEPPTFMSVNVAISQIIESEEHLKTGVFGDIRKVKAYGVARIGSDSQKIVSGTLEELEKVDFGAPLHSVIIASPELHLLEQDMFDFYNVNKKN